MGFMFILSTHKNFKIILRMKKLFTIIALSLLLTACGGDTETAETENAHDLFFANLSTLCGESLVGGSTFPDDPEHPLVATELRNHISSCDENKIRIELYRDGDYWHGAWVIERRDEGLHLFHDHLGDVRTMEDLGEGDFHGYGGYADDSGTGTTQYFPADEATEEIIPAAATNVWMMSLDLENGRFIYYLERHNEPRFRAEMFVN